MPLTNKETKCPTAKQFRQMIDRVKDYLRKHSRTRELPGLTPEARKWRFK